MEVEFLSMSADEDVITRLFRVKNVTRVSHPCPLIAPHPKKEPCAGHIVPLSSMPRMMTFTSPEMP